MKVTAVFNVGIDVDIPNEAISKIENIEDDRIKGNTWFNLVSKYSDNDFFNTTIFDETILPSEAHNVEFCAILDPEKDDALWEN